MRCAPASGDGRRHTDAGDGGHCWKDRPDRCREPASAAWRDPTSRRGDPSPTSCVPGDILPPHAVEVNGLGRGRMPSFRASGARRHACYPCRVHGQEDQAVAGPAPSTAPAATGPGHRAAFHGDGGAGGRWRARRSRRSSRRLAIGSGASPAVGGGQARRAHRSGGAAGYRGAAERASIGGHHRSARQRRRCDSLRSGALCAGGSPAGRHHRGADGGSDHHRRPRRHSRHLTVGAATTTRNQGAAELRR